MPLRARRAAGGLAIVTLLLGGCAGPTVVRVVDGCEVEGRYVSDYAYALYGRAAYEEAAIEEAPGGDRPGSTRSALAALEAAATSDEDSPQIWTAIGALRCRPPGADLASAEAALQRARGLDPEDPGVYRELARCRLTAATSTSDPALSRARRREALAAAERAIQLDPDDVSAASVTASLLVGEGRAPEAKRLLRALTIRRADSAAAWRALYTFAHATNDEALAERAARRTREIAPRLAPELEAGVPALSPLPELDAALRRDDLAAARHHAQRAHLPLSEVAVRAAALGRATSARDEASVVLAADPADVSARVALAVAADLGRDPGALAAAMELIPAPPAALTPPSPLARLLFAELLYRRIDEGAARAWLGPLPASTPSVSPSDPLLASVTARVRARFADAAPR